MNNTPAKTFVVRRGQTAVPNRTIYDTYTALGTEDTGPGQLSIQALGVLLLALSRPDTAPSGYRAFLGRGLGRDALLKALKELGVAGHRHQFKRNGPNGHMVTDTIVSEVPLTTEEAEAEWRGFVDAQDQAAQEAARAGAAAFARAAQDAALEAAQRDAQEAARAFQELADKWAAEAAPHRAPENGAPAGQDQGAPCAGLPAHGKPAHLSVPDSQVSKETHYVRPLETEKTNGEDQEPPAQGGAVGPNDAEPGTGRAAVQALLAARRAKQDRKKDGLRPGHGQEPGA
ncbi:hypothetical protein QEX65_gp19 [Arthrobacter phage Noely]|uniref:Uncharacterized protein n=1 Tax=Arthrobacter phage Noely TaxID=2419964 RepID=A0A3G2KAH1_9CAUD|nr:hypothetical protein QEX65_gp19 [Arthrobacter phage Noely]AYN55960.1 hypothetical protein PBI_NOELY_19 [Arthrobacter phage Noely]